MKRLNCLLSFILSATVACSNINIVAAANELPIASDFITGQSEESLQLTSPNNLPLPGAVCNCAEQCTEENDNPDCPVCTDNLSGCVGTPVQEPECVCTERCDGESGNVDCPVCVNDLSACTGMSSARTFLGDFRQ